MSQMNPNDLRGMVINSLKLADPNDQEDFMIEYIESILKDLSEEVEMNTLLNCIKLAFIRRDLDPIVIVNALVKVLGGKAIIHVRNDHPEVTH